MIVQHTYKISDNVPSVFLNEFCGLSYHLTLVVSFFWIQEHILCKHHLRKRSLESNEPETSLKPLLLFNKHVIECQITDFIWLDSWNIISFPWSKKALWIETHTDGLYRPCWEMLSWLVLKCDCTSLLLTGLTYLVHLKARMLKCQYLGCWCGCSWGSVLSWPAGCAEGLSAVAAGVPPVVVQSSSLGARRTPACPAAAPVQLPVRWWQPVQPQPGPQLPNDWPETQADESEPRHPLQQRKR